MKLLGAKLLLLAGITGAEGEHKEGGKHYTLRALVVEKYGSEIHKHALEKGKQSEVFLPAYAKKTSEIISNLSDNERAELEQQVEVWNAQGPPDGSKVLKE